MLDFHASPYLVLFARLCIGGVFLASGIAKLADRPGTAASMARYPFLPSGSGKMLGFILPLLELAVGVMLLLGLYTIYAALAAICLFALFSVLILYDLATGSNQSCHCFGKLSDEKLTPLALVRNLLLILLALIIVPNYEGWLSFDASNFPGLNLGPHVISDCFTCTPPDAPGAIPVLLLAILCVVVIVFGGRMVSIVRTTLRGMSLR